MWFPSADFIHAINASVVQADPVDRKHGGGVQVVGLVERVVEATANTRMPEGDPFAGAALLLHGLAVGHPFKGGNKRTAFIVAAAFLAANGWYLDLPEGAASDYMRTLTATRPLVAAVEGWLRSNSRKG